MSPQWIWVKSDTPPKCKLSKWEKQSRVAEAEEFLRTFFRPRFVARRHNDQWIVIADDLSLPAAFDEMRTNPWFQF